MWKSAGPGSWHRAVWTTPYAFLTYWTQPLLSVFHFSDMLLALLGKSKMISPRAFAQTGFLLIPSIASGLEGCSLIPVKPLGYWPAEFWLKLLHTGKQPQKIRDLFYRRVNWWVSRLQESGHSWGEGRGKSVLWPVKHTHALTSPPLSSREYAHRTLQGNPPGASAAGTVPHHPAHHPQCSWVPWSFQQPLPRLLELSSEDTPCYWSLSVL